MRWVELSVATTLAADLPRRPSAAGTFLAKDVGGTQLQSGTPTLDSVNTTLSSAAAAQAASIAVSSAAGITVGRRYLIAGAEESGGEQVTVTAVSGTTVTLARRLRRAQASGATFQSTRTSFALSAIATVGRNHRVEYTWPTADAQPTYVLPFDVTRYVPQTYLTTEDLRDLDPLVSRRIAEGTWLPAVVEQAWQILTRHVAQKLDPGSVVGVVDLTTPHGYLTRSLLAETAGEDAKGYLEEMRARYTQERDAVLASVAVDEDQDGSAEQRGWWRSQPLVRA